MQARTLLTLFFLCCLSCKNPNTKKADNEKFDKIKWAIKNETDYPFRDKMLTDLMTNYQLHGLKKDEILNLLGQPSRSDSLYLFYTIASEHLGFFPLHTKSLVIKLTKDSTVDWRKIHE